MSTEYCCKYFKRWYKSEQFYKERKHWYICLEVGDVKFNNCPWCGMRLENPTISELTNGMFNLIKNPKTCEHKYRIKYSHSMNGIWVIDYICKDCGSVIFPDLSEKFE